MQFFLYVCEVSLANKGNNWGVCLLLVPGGLGLDQYGIKGTREKHVKGKRCK
jgi:hypothetical protein